MKSNAADLARELFDGLKAGVQRFGEEVGATLDQKVNQGSSELANSLFHQSNGFVLYGPGQNPGLWSDGRNEQHDQEHGHAQERDQGHAQEQGHEMSRER
jgi:hypothetical protein